GRGADVVTYAKALARIGQEGHGVRTFFSGHSSIGQGPILAWGNDEQKRRLLPRSTRGEIVCAFGLTEPGAGSNPREMAMTYRRRGDEFVLSGEKYLISNGGIAGVIITFAYPEGRTGRISAFLVETGRPGFSSESLEPKVGNVTADTVRFALRDYAIPAANLLGAEGEGLAIAMDALVGGRLSVAAGCLGVIEDCLAEVVAYATARHQHGQPIARGRGPGRERGSRGPSPGRGTSGRSRCPGSRPRPWPPPRPRPGTRPWPPPAPPRFAREPIGWRPRPSCTPRAPPATPPIAP